MNRELLKLSLPTVLALLASMAMQVVDIYFIGKLGTAELAGASIASAMFSTVFTFITGVLLGVDFPLSRAVGAGNRTEASALLTQAIWIGALLSLPATLLLVFLPELLPSLGYAPELTDHCREFLRPLSISLLPGLLFMAMRTYFQATGRASLTFWAMLIANVINFAANWALVLGNAGFPKLGLEGSAIASVIARWSVAIGLGIILWRDFKNGILVPTQKKLDQVRIRLILTYGVPAGLQVLAEVGVFAFATLLAGRLGAVATSAHQIVLQVASLTFMIPLGLSSASSVLIARAHGSGDLRYARALGFRALGLSGVFMAMTGITLFVAERPILGIFSSDLAVLNQGSSILLFAALFQVSDGLQVVGSGILRGFGNTKIALAANAVGHWGVGLPLGAWLCFWQNWGLSGLWIGLALGLSSVAVILIAAYARISRQPPLLTH
jgi:MATE family multidrug resistance protein